MHLFAQRTVSTAASFAAVASSMFGGAALAQTQQPEAAAAPTTDVEAHDIRLAATTAPAADTSAADASAADTLAADATAGADAQAREDDSAWQDQEGAGAQAQDDTASWQNQNGSGAQVQDDAASFSPQILNGHRHNEVGNVGAQINKAVTYNAARTAAAANDWGLSSQGNGLSSGAVTSASGEVAKPAEGTLTSEFGMRWGSMHNGVDIANGIGTPIYAAMAGTVIDSGPASGFGNWIRIQHDDGSITVYGHMATLNVSVGERVSAGQQIAGMGNEGFSTGSHLHFEYRPGGGAPADPMPLFNQNGISL